MTIIKLDAIDSTNDFLKKISAEKPLDDYTTVVAKVQTAGRGQMGSVWETEPYKNLTFSIYKEVLHIPRDHQFYISMAVSLALLSSLKGMGIPKLKIKWPNDILSANQKISGILIENIIKQNELYASIIGIGLNINQTDFTHLPAATSMKLLSGKFFDHEEVMHQIIYHFKKYAEKLAEKNYRAIMDEYEEQLFRKDKPSTFQNKEGSLFTGYIKGVHPSGKLKVLLEDDILSEFDFKEVKLLYN